MFQPLGQKTKYSIAKYDQRAKRNQQTTFNFHCFSMKFGLKGVEVRKWCLLLSKFLTLERSYAHNFKDIALIHIEE